MDDVVIAITCRSRFVGHKVGAMQQTKFGQLAENGVFQTNGVIGSNKIRDLVDDAASQLAVENEDVLAGATGQHIRADATVQQVIATAAQ